MTYQLPEAFTPEEVAERLQINPDLIRSWITAGKVGCIRGSRRAVRLLPEHIEQLIRHIEKPATGAPASSSPFGATPRSAARRRAS